MCSSETSVDFQRITRRYMPGDGILRNHRCENLKSYTNKQTNSVALVSERTIPSDHRLFVKLVPTYADRVCCLVRTTDPYGRIFGFLDRSRYSFFHAAPQLYSRDWVDPFQTHYLQYGSAGNWTRDHWICSQRLWQLDHRGGPNPTRQLIFFDRFLFLHINSLCRKYIDHLHGLSFCTVHQSVLQRNSSSDTEQLEKNHSNCHPATFTLTTHLHVTYTTCPSRPVRKCDASFWLLVHCSLLRIFNFLYQFRDPWGQ
jgi:hypothetical protein